MFSRLYEISSIFPEECKYIMIDSIDFSGRLLSCLHRTDIWTVEDLLNMDITQLEQTNGFGIGCRRELIKLLKSDYLREYLTMLNNEPGKRSRPILFVKDLVKPELLSFGMCLVDELHLSNGIGLALKDNGFSSIMQILLMPADTLAGLRGIGQSGAERICKALNEFSKMAESHKYPFGYNSKFASVPLKDILAIDYEDDRNKELAEFVISNRIVSILKKRNISTIGSLLELVPEEIFQISGFGETSYCEVMSALMNYAVNNNRASVGYLFSNENWKTYVEIIISRLSSVTLKRKAQDYIDAYRLIDPKWKTRTHSSKPLLRLLRSLDADEESFRFANWLIRNEYLEVRYKRILDLLNSGCLMEQSVINLRLSGRSLGAIAQRFRTKKENVRQHENKFFKKFFKAIALRDLIAHVYLNTLDPSIIYQSDLEAVVPKYAGLISYCLSHGDQIDVQYNAFSDAFIISAPKRRYTNVMKGMKALPDIFANSEEEQIIDVFCKTTKFSRASAQRLIQTKYEVYGNYYTCSKMTNSKMYKVILNKYFKRGIRLYDQDQISEFRNELNIEFDHPNSIPDDDHALISAIRASSLLCGRGTYCAKSDQSYMSDELEKKIANYIERKRYLVIKAIFSKFKDELHENGIDNYYHLLGVLKETFGSKYYFKKDYISTSNRFSGIYEAILSYVKRSKSPVSKDEILSRFPGTTSLMIQLAINDSEVLNLFGKYIHVEKMNFRPAETDYLKTVLNTLLEGKNILNCRDIYEYISNDNQAVLNRLGIHHSFSLFSILQYLFNDEYQFTRPWIARFGVEISKPLDLVRDYLESSETASIPEMIEIAQSAGYRHTGIQKFIDSFNTTHLMISRFEMQSIEKLQVSEKIAHEIEEKLVFIGTSRLDDVIWQADLEEYRLPVNEWVLYSLLKKWGNKYEVIMVKPYKTSIPVIAEKGKLDLSRIDTAMRKEYSEDDDDLADLLLDTISGELEDEL